MTRRTMPKEHLTVNLPVKVLSAREAAAYLAISLPTLFRLTRAGEMAHVRIGRSLRFRVEDLDAFLAARVTTNRKSPQTRIIGRKKKGGP